MNVYRRIKSDSLTLFMNCLNLDNWEVEDLNEMFGLPDNGENKKKGILTQEKYSKFDNITSGGMVIFKPKDEGELNEDLENRLETVTGEEIVIFKPTDEGEVNKDPRRDLVSIAMSPGDTSSSWLRRKREISPSRGIPTSKLRRLQDRDTDSQRKEVLLVEGDGSSTQLESGMAQRISIPTVRRRSIKSKRRLKSITGQTLITSIFSPRSKTPQNENGTNLCVSGGVDERGSQVLLDSGDDLLNE